METILGGLSEEFSIKNVFRQVDVMNFHVESKLFNSVVSFWVETRDLGSEFTTLLECGLKFLGIN
jgi:hypothetical protein